MTQLVAVTVQNTEIAVADLVERTKYLIDNSKAASTRKAYRTAWREFQRFAKSVGVNALDANPETVALYISHLVEKGQRPSTIQKKLAAISQKFITAGLESPVRNPGVRAVLQGVRRTLGSSQNQKQPLMTDDIRKLVDRIPDNTLRGKRERLHLLLSFAMGARRSEVGKLNLEDVRLTEEGLRITIGRSKTDQEGRGVEIGVCYGSDPKTCPVRALIAWRNAAQLGESGPVFRFVDSKGVVTERRLQDRELSRLIKRYAIKAGLDPAAVSSHSCRAGFVSQALNHGGATLTSVMRQTRHKSINTLKKYDRPDLFTGNASSKLGL